MTTGPCGAACPEDGARQDAAEACLHASTVAVEGRAAMIRGASGSGKSGLALQLIALGAELVADDCTCLRYEAEGLIARAPEAIRGRIEARGVGVLRCPVTPRAMVVLIVDMDHEEEDRLPPMRYEDVMGARLPVIRKNTAAHFPAAVMTYLRHGRSD